MRVRTNIMLDEEVKRVVMDHLQLTGMSLSGFINAILAEFAQVIQGQPSCVPDKAVKDMTLEEFGTLANYWIQKASE